MEFWNLKGKRFLRREWVIVLSECCRDEVRLVWEVFIGLENVEVFGGCFVCSGL